MLRVCVVVREAGGLAPEYVMRFDLPTLPRVGTYLSVQRPGDPSRLGEDLIVRQVWWKLKHPDKREAMLAGADGVGHLDDVIIECAKAIGPYSIEEWRSELMEAERRGLDVEVFDVERPGFASQDSGAGLAPATQPGNIGRRGDAARGKPLAMRSVKAARSTDRR